MDFQRGRAFRDSRYSLAGKVESAGVADIFDDLGICLGDLAMAWAEDVKGV